MSNSIMIQGTCSNAGKSIIAAGLCRIFFQDGYMVAPFKSQNMALNSYVTKDSLEMGRAQAVQAMAARIEPDVRMNPILLKPNSDTGSQVIVNGLPIGNMDFKKYKVHKKNLIPIINNAYKSLSKEFDLIVIEGAGSPAEINLKKDDIVNSYIANITDSPVLIVGDIDRGGVFSHLIGTLELLSTKEKERVKGFIINKFRGDEQFLKPGLKFLEKRSGKKVFGVVPMIKDFKLPDEDSVEFKRSIGKNKFDDNYSINIALIDLPHISNFTDFDPFKYDKEVNFYVAENTKEVDNADIIIIPGSKNVIGDADYLKEKGFYKKLKDLSDKKFIIGICGGYQILGKAIFDPESIESNKKMIDGIGLLNIITTLENEKILKQVNGYCTFKNINIFGYEIHHGISNINESSFMVDEKNNVLGCINKNKNIWGTYIHGIFDSNDFRMHLLNNVLKKKKIALIKNLQSFNLEHEFDRLAEILRKNVNMKLIYQTISIKKRKK